VPPPYLLLACNPDIELHWIYRRFHPESHEHQTTYAALGYQMVDMPSTSNRFLGETNLALLLQQDEAFIRRNVEGVWGLPEGAIHTVPAASYVDGDDALLEHFRRDCLLFRTMDHGDSAPTCCVWWAVDRDQNVFGYREYYKAKALISAHRQAISDLSIGEDYDLNLADPSIFYQAQQPKGSGKARWSVADEYADTRMSPRSTAIYWKGADNNELGTRNRINEYLRIDPTHTHPITRAAGAPRLYFVRRSAAYPQGLYHVLRETRSQRRVKVGTELGKPIFSDDRDDTVADHGYDPVRYLIASRPSLLPSASGAPDGSFAQIRRRLIAPRRRF
jgi:hypothetical protein